MEEKLRQFALSANGSYTHIDSVKKGQRYFCLNCNTEVIAKRGSERQHHFAHKPTSELNDMEKTIVTDCLKSNESYLHKAFKEGLYQILKEKIENNEEFIVHWNPSNIGEQKRNLLKLTKRIEIEKYVQELKPDLTLYDKNENPYVAIEIVVDNKPSKQKLAHYSVNRIFLYEIDLDKNNLDCLNNISRIASYPTLFSFIPDPKMYPEIPEKRICKQCGETTSFSYLNIKVEKCPYCQTVGRFAYRTLINKNNKSIRYFFDAYTTISEKNIFDIHGLTYNKNYRFICEKEDCKELFHVPIAKITTPMMYPLGYFCQKCQGKRKEGVIYNGQKFQNQAEAKWAEFFDKQSIKYEYNPKKYRFFDINPFPVFYLKDSNQLFRANKYVNFESKDRAKFEKLARETGLDVVEGFEDGCFYVIDEMGLSYGEESLFVQCQNCKKHYFTTNVGDWTCKHCHYYDSDYTYVQIGTGEDAMLKFGQ